ncbi:hypothetical protein AVEN_486-1 [Araneus ventricosus]|uniref:Uncharacterized protein n=1 Tax=Araneus ventricosus TaxID=182803 RepID=A0A4Y2LJW2_ARAVE|nr:hypothetical protein AVEN_486-1 [Araneus ventricosus]
MKQLLQQTSVLGNKLLFLPRNNILNVSLLSCNNLTFLHPQEQLLAISPDSRIDPQEKHLNYPDNKNILQLNASNIHSPLNKVFPFLQGGKALPILPI